MVSYKKKESVASLKFDFLIFGQRPRRGRSPVQHRDFRASIPPFVCLSPPPIRPLRPEICSLKPEICPIRPEIYPLRPEIYSVGLKICPLRPRILPFRP